MRSPPKEEIADWHTEPEGTFLILVQRVTEWCSTVKCMVPCKVLPPEWGTNCISSPYQAFNLASTVKIPYHGVQRHKESAGGKKRERAAETEEKCGLLSHGLVSQLIPKQRLTEIKNV